MKKHLLLLLATLLPLVASAQTKVEINGIWYNITSESAKTAEVTFKGSSPTEYNEYSGSITLPATVTYKGVTYSVTSIGKTAFFRCPSLTAINILEGVKSVGNSAFGDCNNLTAITFPKSLTGIEEQAFAWCTNLTAITIPENSMLTSIGENAFSNCSSLTAITLPEGVTSIGSGAFSDCSSLTAVTIPKGVTSIESSAFYGCSSLTAVTIPESVTSIEGSAFSKCSGLTAINIPEGVTSIGDYAFNSCSSLTAITIPESVMSIGNYAFENCSGLTAINIPKGVTSIGSNAFYNCSGLTAITVEEENTVFDSRDRCNAIIETNSNTLIVGCSTTIIPESVTSIGSWAFYRCSNLTSITIPEGVTSIEGRAFEDCSSLTSITIPESVMSIGNYAFENCSNLINITLPENGMNFGYQVFEGTAWHNNQLDGLVYLCNVLYEYKGGMPANTSIEVREGTTSIATCAFRQYDNLTSITLPESLKNIGEEAFSECTGLTSINIPEGVTSIGGRAFYRCSAVTTINIPNDSKLRSIGQGAFVGCENLTNITIPAGVTSIEKHAFLGCFKLASPITIPEGITTIGEATFNGCNSIPEITLPKSLRSIEAQAFSGCINLLNVYCYARELPSASTGSFDYLPFENATLHVPSVALEAYKATAPWSSFGSFAILDIPVTDITLSQTEATLIEGEALTLTTTITPTDADDISVTWSSSNEEVAMVSQTGKVITLIPGIATITATANDGSGVSASCKITVKERILGKCATPTISYMDGKIKLTCETEDATIKSSVSDNSTGDYEATEYNIIPTYTITAYATKEKYENSDAVNLILCWVPCEEKHEEDNGILTIPAKPVLIQCQGGAITLSGLAGGTEVAAYDLNGIALATATATNGTATLTTDLTAGSIAIVKIGGHSIKVVIK